MSHEVKEQHCVITVSGPNPKLSVRRFSVKEGLNELYSVRIIANSGDPNIDLEKIVGHAALFQLSGGQLHAQYGTRRWTGIVAHAEQVHVDPTSTGESTYYFHIVPTFWLATQRRETRTFKKMQIPWIIRLILNEWGIESIAELNGVYKEHEYIVQYNETDFDFINRLCEWAGITYYFKFQAQEQDGWGGIKREPPEEPKKGFLAPKPDPQDEAIRKKREERDKANRATDANMHAGWTTINEPGEPDDETHDDAKQKKPGTAVPLKLAFSDGVHENEPRPLPVHYVDEPNEAAQEEFITEMRLIYNVAPGRHTIRDFDYRGKLDFQLFGKEKEAAKVPEDFYEQYHYQPGAFKVEDKPSGDTPLADTPKAWRHLQKEVGEPMADRRQKSDRDSRRLVRFVTNCIDLGPGVVFTVNHHPREDLDLKKYVIRKFTLEGYTNDKWTYEGEAQLQSDPFYPVMKTPKPRIRGLQSAVVTGPEGNEEIHCDELGRVKIQFHWDRDGKYNDKSSCWVRVAHDWAGTGFGTQYIPRIGQEVLVAFIEGDPDLPVIVGRAYNGINQVIYELPTFKERSVWKTDSTPDADGFSEITFEDLKEKEKIFVQAETDTQKLVKQYETDRIGENMMTVVGEHRTAVVSKLDAIMVGERYFLTTIKPPNEQHTSLGKLKKGDDLSIWALEQPDVTALKTAIELKDKRAIFTTGKATVAFIDDDIRIQAGGMIHVKAKGGDIIIEGNKVQLNPGSAPPDAPQPATFKLPPHDGWKRHAADDLDELGQRMKRMKIETPGLEPPKPPDYVAPPETKKHVCFLMATLVHCMHPDSPREPCQDEKRDDFHDLEIVPEYPDRPEERAAGDLAGRGERGAVLGNVPTVLERPKDDDDPRERVNWRGKTDPKGTFVRKNDDVITLKSKVNDNCGKHTLWRVSGKKSGLETHEGENFSTEIQGWIKNKSAHWEFTTEDFVKIADGFRKTKENWDNNEMRKSVGLPDAERSLEQKQEAFDNSGWWGRGDARRELEQAKANHEEVNKAYEEKKKKGDKWRLPLQVRCKGLSWTADAAPRRLNISAKACTGPQHDYQVFVYPSDRFNIDIGFGFNNIRFWKPFDDMLQWAFKVLGDGPFGKSSLVFNSNVYLGGTAQWKEYKRDHRAFYSYEIKLSFDPLFSATISHSIHLYHVLMAIPGLQPAGILAKVFSKLFDMSIKLSFSGAIKGELSFVRKGPDDLKGDWTGKVGGAITLALALDAFLIKKEIAGAGASGQTTLSIDAKPKEDRTPMEPPTLIASGKWGNFTVSMYYGIKWWKKSKNIEVFAAKSLGPWEVKPITSVMRFMNSKYQSL